MTRLLALAHPGSGSRSPLHLGLGAALALAISLAGCLSVPDGPPVECKATSDCDSANGEVCLEGTCWGNPPPGPFAALISPPGERKTDLVSREMLLDGLPQDGYFGTFELEEPVTFSGQIVCPTECSTAELAAEIVVTRPSGFTGGPLFRQAFDTDPRTGAFQLVLPPVRSGEPEYSVTITPGKRQQPGMTTSMAELVPPLRTTLAIDKNESGKTLDLGEGIPLTITGTIVDTQDNPATNYRVVAFGRWDLNSAPSEVSTVAFIGQTDNEFTIRIAEGVVGPVDIVATPIAGTLQPTLRLTLNPAASLALPPRLVRPDTAGDVEVTIVVQGTGTGGDVTGVIGARVTVSGALAGNTEATFTTQGDSDATGSVSLKVPGGALASSYRVSVVPQTNANVGVVFDRPLVITEQTRIKLPDRLAIVGTVLDHNGNPLKDVQVTAHPALRFQWSLTADPQAFVAGIPPAAIVTEEGGEFVLFVDPFIAADGEIENEDVWGYYDISFVPTETTNAPLWTEVEIEIPRDPTLTQLPVGPMGLPDAAHIHGTIVDPFGELVEDAELRLFRVEDPQAFLSYCANLNNPPATCPIPAFLLGRGLSDADGITRLTLPRL